jgi:hypothetical protein
VILFYLIKNIIVFIGDKFMQPQKNVESDSKKSQFDIFTKIDHPLEGLAYTSMFNIGNLFTCLEQGTDKVRKARNKEIVPVIGYTRSGKSTTICYAIGLPMRFDVDEENGKSVVKIGVGCECFYSTVVPELDEEFLHERLKPAYNFIVVVLLIWRLFVRCGLSVVYLITT